MIPSLTCRDPELRSRGLQYNKDVYIGENAWIDAGAIIVPVGRNTVIYYLKNHGNTKKLRYAMAWSARYGPASFSEAIREERRCGIGQDKARLQGLEEAT